MSAAPSSPPISEHEAEQLERAGASDRPLVVFVHGLWLLPSSWDRWQTLFGEAGFATLAPGWPDDPETVDYRAHAQRKSQGLMELSRLEPALAATLDGVTNVRLLFADALDIDLAALDPRPEGMVANLPYGVAATVLLKSIEATAGSRCTPVGRRRAAAG